MQHLRTLTLLRPTTSLRSISHTLDEYYAKYPSLHPEDDFSSEKSLDARASMYSDDLRPVFRDEMVSIGREVSPRVREITELRRTSEGLVVIFVPLHYTLVLDATFDFLRKRGIMKVAPADQEGINALIVINSSVIAPSEAALVITHALINAGGDIDVSEVVYDMYDGSLNLSYKIQIKEQYERKGS